MIKKTVLMTWMMFVGIMAENSSKVNPTDTSRAEETVSNMNQLDLTMDDVELSFENTFADAEGTAAEGSTPSLWDTYISDPMRVTLKHELAYKVASPTDWQNNRSTVRWEYSKLLMNNFFIRFDSRLKAFLEKDHRSNITSYWVNEHNNEADVAFETKVREGFIQSSFFNTSVKAGVQILAWGESEVAAITDVITPRDYTDPFILSLEELRFGQPMLTIDQFTGFGDWSLFFVPYPLFNEIPEKGNAYFIDAFNGQDISVDENDFEENFEFGARWKKTFGSSDVDLMGASVIDNDYIFEADSLGLAKTQRRYHVTGMTFNFVVHETLIKGEAGLKVDKAFNNSALKVIEKNRIDASLGVEYLYSTTLTLGIEGVNNYILYWDEEIQGFEKNSFTLLLFASKLLMHDNLAISAISMMNGPNMSFFNLITTSYHWNDYLTFSFDATLPFTQDNDSDLWVYKDQKQLAAKAQYQF